ncbi:SMI1/KNR4 family protein [Bacillus sp. CHD6a]|uniref:SMI1/KNR4 family protein n=1 Tax=Bacillus sp. CHD6a TaxID=1643452 RepID=UPI000761F44A|nr:SMI1/KNR4 family protein [Bacillus sp. CHD6a]
MGIKKAFEIIEKHSDEGDFIGEIQEDLIYSAEETLNVKLPSSYRLFLKRYGVGDIFGEEIYGLGIEEGGVPSMVWITKHFRQKEGLPEHLVCFYFAGYDNMYYCLDCSNVKDEKDDNAAVVSYLSGSPKEAQKFETVFPSFGEFLIRTLEDSIES